MLNCDNLNNLLFIKCGVNAANSQQNLIEISKCCSQRKEVFVFHKKRLKSSVIISRSDQACVSPPNLLIQGIISVKPLQVLFKAPQVNSVVVHL